ncbi:hypothetical protein [Thalassobius sp. MITS945101]|uniref:hypothetical protein n=1 Tax=Thalassobius sp. MITS945101 TaxID=3096994 RepID=UPI00399B388C
MQAIAQPVPFVTSSQTINLSNQASETLRALMVFLGVVFCLAAFGLWLVPDAMASAEARVIRAGLTCLFVGAGFFLFRKGREETGQLEQEIDLLRGEVRHILRGRDGVGRVVARMAFCDLRFELGDNGRYSARYGAEMLFELPRDVVHSAPFQKALRKG